MPFYLLQYKELEYYPDSMAEKNWGYLRKSEIYHDLEELQGRLRSLYRENAESHNLWLRHGGSSDPIPFKDITIQRCAPQDFPEEERILEDANQCYLERTSEFAEQLRQQRDRERLQKEERERQELERLKNKYEVSSV